MGPFRAAPRELHHLLYEHNGSLSKVDIRTWVKKAGCDLGRFTADLGSSSARRQIDDDIALAKRVGARGTPSFFINGRYLAGAQAELAFSKIVDEELAEAERRIGSGVARDQLYDRLMRGAKPTR